MDHGSRFQYFTLMFIVQKVRNIIRGIMQQYGTEGIKRQLWNYEFLRGYSGGLDSMINDYVYPHVEKHANSGRILDLGCGPGCTADQLNSAAYSFYTGVDICDIAIAKAEKENYRNKHSRQKRICSVRHP